MNWYIVGRNHLLACVIGKERVQKHLAVASGGESASFLHSEFLLRRNDAINVWRNNASSGHLSVRKDNLLVKAFCGVIIPIILCLFCLKFSRFSTKWSQSFLSKVSLRHYHKLEPVEESIELSGKPGADGE